MKFPPPARPRALLAFIAFLAPRAHAEEDVFRFYQEEAEVVTASRRPQPAWRSPVAVDVVTAEEIAAYGYKNIWDAMRFRVGMDVVEGRAADGNRAVVSARGFSRDFVSEMQVLVDGRPVYSPFLGGVYWASTPVQMQDIERLEIVRGPNAALYGSNAALGVVNIITRKPTAAAKGGLAARGGNRGVESAEAAEAGGRLGGLRISHTFEQDPGASLAGGPGDANDFLHSNKLNMRGRLTPDRATELEAFAGGSWLTMGVPGFPSRTRATHEQDYEMLRASRSLGDAGTVEAIVSHTDFELSAHPYFVGRVDIRTYQYDAELLHRGTWAGGTVESVAGAEWRLLGLYSDQSFNGRPSQKNRIARGYTHQSLNLRDDLTLVAGASAEDSGTGGLQSAWQAAALYSPRENDSVRLSYSRAPTLPPLFNKSGDYQISSAVRIVGNPDLSPQQSSCWEAGWTDRTPSGSLKTDVTLYWLEIRDRNNYVVRSAGVPTVISYDNGNRATARGVEISEKLSVGKDADLFANYTFEKIQDDKGPTDPFRTDLRHGTPVHKANLGGRVHLGRGWSASAVLGYKDAYDANSTTRGTRATVPRSFRLDARLSWSPRPGWELFIAGRNLLQPRTLEYADGIASPRAGEAGVVARFGL